MRILLLGVGSDTLLAEFDVAGIHYVHFLGEPREIQEAGEWVEIANVSMPCIASVLAAWISARASRKVVITLHDERTLQMEGMSVHEVERLLPLAKTIIASETKEPDQPVP